MDSLLNRQRPPAFCPGCSHDNVVRALDKTLVKLGLTGPQVVLVSDIGCSGLFDTYFNTHAMHGLHGRALTYATGIKLARPELTVVVTMGDGGLGIGGAHVVSTCRRNIDLTLLVLNNFNYGMTGGQCSPTTPAEAEVASGFLNHLELPVDICRLAGTAGAGFVARRSAYCEDLSATLADAISHNGFSVVEIRGICTGRYSRRNKITPESIRAELDTLPSLEPFSGNSLRKEYGAAYRAEAAGLTSFPTPKSIAVTHRPPGQGRREVLILGSAGQRIVTAGEILCLAGLTAGLHAVQKNDYPITVMRGHSVSEIILSKKKIGYTGIDLPDVVVALGTEGIERRKNIFARLPEGLFVLAVAGVDIPKTPARVETIDFAALKIRKNNWALGALARLSLDNSVISKDMLLSALSLKFKDPVLKSALTLIETVNNYKIKGY